MLAVELVLLLLLLELLDVLLSEYSDIEMALGRAKVLALESASDTSSKSSERPIGSAKDVGKGMLQDREGGCWRK